MRIILLVVLLMYACLDTSLGQNFYRDMITPKNKVMIGIGPSIMYSNTAGRIRTLGFKILPSFTAAYSHQVNPYISLRGSAGIQWVQSNLPVDDEVKQAWGEKNKAHAFQGQAYFLDLMPVLQLFPSRHNGERFNFYVGIGLGFMQVFSEQQRMLENQNIYGKTQISTPYIPLRGGIGKRLNDKWELLFEGTFMGTFSDELDGNSGKKHIKNDHLIQGQLVLKKHI